MRTEIENTGFVRHGGAGQKLRADLLFPDLLPLVVVIKCVHIAGLISNEDEVLPDGWRGCEDILIVFNPFF